MKTLILNLGEVDNSPMGAPGARWSAVAEVSYDRDVNTDDVRVPRGVPLPIDVLGSGLASVDVIANDDPSLTDASKGFGVTVRATFTALSRGRSIGPAQQEKRATWNLVINSAAPNPVKLSTLSTATPVPPQVTTIADLEDALADSVVASALADPQIARVTSTLTTSSSSVVAFSIADEAGNRSWVEGDPQGNPTTHAAGKLRSVTTDPLGLSANAIPGGFHITDESGTHLAEASTDGAGRLYPWAAERVALRSQAFGAALPVTSFTCWGDSLTFGQTATGTRFGDVMAATLGIPSVVMGYPANGSANIAFRSGALPVGFAEDVTLAPGATVTVTPTVTDGWRVGGSLVHNMPATVTANNGSGADGTGSMIEVSVTLRQNVGASTVGTFSLVRPADGGPTVTIPKGTPVVGIEGSGLNHGGLVLLLGRNNIDTPAAIMRDVTAILGHNTRTPRQFIIAPPTASQNSGAGDLTKVRNITAQLQARFGGHVVDLQKYLASAQALTDAGITATSQDTTDIAAGWIPHSLLATTDSTHYNAAGHTVAGKWLAAQAITLGWKG